MNHIRRFFTMAALVGVALLGAMSAQTRFDETDLVTNQQVNGVPTLTDKNGVIHVAKFFDANLKNPWGVGTSALSPFWVADNNSGKSTLYRTDGTPLSLIVSMPSPGDPLGSSGTPTGEKKPGP